MLHVALLSDGKHPFVVSCTWMMLTSPMSSFHLETVAKLLLLLCDWFRILVSDEGVVNEKESMSPECCRSRVCTHPHTPTNGSDCVGLNPMTTSTPSMVSCHGTGD